MSFLGIFNPGPSPLGQKIDALTTLVGKLVANNTSNLQRLNNEVRKIMADINTVLADLAAIQSAQAETNARLDAIALDEAGLLSKITDLQNQIASGAIPDNLAQQIADIRAAAEATVSKATNLDAQVA